jgi:hypothetical protein
MILIMCYDVKICDVVYYDNYYYNERQVHSYLLSIIDILHKKLAHMHEYLCFSDQKAIHLLQLKNRELNQLYNN